MRTTHTRNDVKITLDKRGADTYTKMSYPLRFGRYSEVEDAEFIFQFNLNNEICFAKAKSKEWLDPQEWLKRTVGNDWVYYSTGGYAGVFAALGEYYLPNLQYPTNSLMGGKPFETALVNDIVNGWYKYLIDRLSSFTSQSSQVQHFIDLLTTNTPQKLAEKSNKLIEACGERVSVLPPDSRHVDYNLIPLTISQGCLYKCRFCKVKSAKKFREKSKKEIHQQLDNLITIYAKDLPNYNSVFLGEHDALCSSSELLLYSVKTSYSKLSLASSYIKGANFFMFGSVDSLLNSEERLFEELHRLPSNFYINVGLESADQKTLDLLGKPITSAKVKEAFAKMCEINRRYNNIEISANFLMDVELPEDHYPSFLELVRDSFTGTQAKGCIYLSPLQFNNPSRELVFDFNRLKLQSRLPTFLYIIQRL